MFTGKNPSYLDKAGIPHLVNHSYYQNRLPTSGDLLNWFANPANGVGTLGGWNNIVWIDLDLKQFATSEECDRAFAAIVAKLPSDTWTEQTHSGGYRIAVKCPKPEFTNFALELGGKHRGEALGAGRFTVLAPTIGASGNIYKVLSDVPIATVDCLESIGVYPVSQPKPVSSPVVRSVTESEVLPGVTSLETVISKKCQDILRGDADGDRSTVLTTLYKEIVGWENWLSANGIRFSDDALELTYEAAAAMDMDDDRADRIVKSIKNPESLRPGLALTKGDDACLFKVKKLLGIKVKAEPQAKTVIELDETEQQLIEQLKKWQSTKIYTPDVQINVQFLTADILTDALAKFDMVCIKSSMGTGKSSILGEALKAYSGAIALGSRNMLLLQFCSNLTKALGRRFLHLQYDKAVDQAVDPASLIALCVDSLTKLVDAAFNDKVLILDEITSTVVHLILSSTVLKAGREGVLEKFEQAVKRASKVILLDGNLTDEVVSYIAAIRGKGEVFKIENTYQPRKPEITMLEGFDRLVTGKASFAAEIMIKVLASRSRCGIDEARAIAVIADSRQTCQALDRILAKAGYLGIEIDAVSSSQDPTLKKHLEDKGYTGVWYDNLKDFEELTIKEFMKDPDRYILALDLDYLILSPTAEMGVDISIKNHFCKGFALFYAVLSTDSQLQFLRRFRDCSDWNIWASVDNSFDKANTHDKTNVDALIQYATEQFISNARAAGKNEIASVMSVESFTDYLRDQIERHKNNIHAMYGWKLLARIYFERLHSRRCLIEALNGKAEISYHDTDSRKGEDDTVKSTREEIRIEDCENIFNADIITIEEAREIRKSYSATPEESYAASRAYIIDRFPGIDETEKWDVEFIYWYQYGEGKKITKQLERQWLVQNIDVAKNLNIKKWLLMTTDYKKAVESFDPSLGGGLQLRLKNIFIPDFKNEFAFLKCAAKLGILQLLKNAELYHAQSDLIQEIHSKVKRSKANQDALRLNVGKMEYMQLVSAIAEKLGIEVDGIDTKDGIPGMLKVAVESGSMDFKPRKDGKMPYRCYTYRSIKDSYPVVYECISRKFTTEGEDFKAAPKPEPSLPVLGVDEIAPLQMQTYPQVGEDADDVPTGEDSTIDFFTVNEFADDILASQNQIEKLEAIADSILSIPDNVIEEVWGEVLKRLENSPAKRRDELKALFAVIEQNARNRKAGGKSFKVATKSTPGKNGVDSWKIVNYQQIEF